MQIAGALRAELTADERSRIHKEPTRSLQAYQLFLQGRHRFSVFIDASLHEAIGYFEQAIVEDPGFALAHAAVAYCYAEFLVQESGSVPRRQAYERAKAAAERAIQLDPALGDAHGVLGLLMFTQEFDWSGAEAELKKALELSPGSPDVYAHYTWLCTATGRFEEAIALARRALELDPLVHRGDYATSLLRAGRLEEAVAACLHNLDREPGYARGHATLGWAYLKLGHSTEGVAHLERAAQLTPGDTGFLAQLGQGYGLVGATDKARDVLHRLEELAQVRYVSPYHLAFVHTGLGELDAAMDLLERAYEVRAGALYNLKGSLLLAPLRSHPRFRALLEKVNLA